MRLAVAAIALGYCASGWTELLAGVSRVSITPLEENIPTQLGGYGARAGKPAEGVHDTIRAKVLLLEWRGERSALVTLDVCSVPICVAEEALAKANVAGLTLERVIMAASHTHAGLEGYALDRRNVADNPHIGIFSEDMLHFVTDRIAAGLREAAGSLQSVQAAAASGTVAGMNRNRRDDAFIDEGLTVLRLDRAGGSPYALVVNFTAHGTIMTEHEMLVSGGWAGVMQRTVEALMGSGVTCLYTNGAEGDIAPRGAAGGSRWEMAEDYGRRIGIEAFRLADGLQPAPVDRFGFGCRWVDLPRVQAAPDFVKIAGLEYHVTQEQLEALLPVMFPAKAPIYALRVNDFQLATFPGEPICQYGLAVKETLRKHGVAHPCVVSLATDSIGYILTEDEYAQSGYEVTASFYGPQLGKVILTEVEALGETLVRD